MALFAGLASIAGLSLFLARFLRRSSALMPIVSVSASILFFTAMGCAGLWLGSGSFLKVAGWAWYAICLAALVYVIAAEKQNILSLFTPGFWLFLAGSAAFIVLFLITKPQFTQWDEFSFWGTAAKVTHNSGQLYTTARSSLIARTYPPGLIVFCYMFQFFGSFAEYGFMAALAVLYMSAFSAACAVFRKNKTASIIFMFCMVLLPVLFESPVPAGNLSSSYLFCMADVPMGVFFGGALCYHFAVREYGARTFIPFGLILAALVCFKDMGFAFALIALFVAFIDLAFCERKTIAFFRLRRWGAWFAAGAVCLLLVLGAYGLWALHLKQAAGIDRFDLGNESQSLGMAAMLTEGVKQLFGIGRTEKYVMVSQNMRTAFFKTPVMLFGSGARVLLLILVISVLAWVMAASRRQRRRVLVFTLAMAFCFLAFYVFNIFTYTFIIKGEEAEILKDYHRYISPFWLSWLMSALAVMWLSATNQKATYYRLRISRAVCMLVCIGLIGGTLWRGNSAANVLNVSPSLYSEREDVRITAKAAEEQGMRPEDNVYIISQWDDAHRFYMLGYELSAVRVPVFAGTKYDKNGEIVTGEAGQPIYAGLAASTLGPPNKESYEIFEIGCTPSQFIEYLLQNECTHVLLDKIDGYIIEEFAPLFSDGLQGWQDDGFTTGHRYYRLEMEKDGSYMLNAQTEGGAA